MQSNLILAIEARCAYDHQWPLLQIIINKKKLFEEFVQDSQIINLSFDSLDHNQIELHYTNKRFGPKIWDTLIDDRGTILRDQYIKITGVGINKCNLNFLIRKLALQKYDGSPHELTHGFMGVNGVFKITYSEPFYDWVQNLREADIVTTSKDKQSGLPFINNYVYKYDDINIDVLLDQLQQLVDNAKNKDASNKHTLP